jgi:hypothetical protein
VLAFGAQRGTLNDPEPMLLVDDHEPERMESHGLLHECVRSHDQVRRSRREFREQGAPRDAAAGARQKRDPEP